MKESLRKIKLVVCISLVFAAMFVSTARIPNASATISIISLNPSTGNVGTQVEVYSNFTTAGGEYQILFDTAQISSGTASANTVRVNVTIPTAAAGAHNITVIDVASGENASSVFTVTTAYSLEAQVPEVPKQLQEGDNVTLVAGITGGTAGTSYAVNITVINPANSSYTTIVNIGVTAEGNGTVEKIYPIDFSSASTSLTGTYSASFNGTLANQEFAVGLTNSTQYHRNETVDVRAVYEPSENVTISITGSNLNFSAAATADNLTGVVEYSNFTVPSNASIGTYTVSVNSTFSSPTIKTPPDLQNFVVPGFDVNITARNLADNVVSGVLIQVFENGTSTTNGTTGTNGVAPLKLEIGSYVCNATYRGETVGKLSINVADILTTDLVCNLTNVAITVITFVDSVNVGIPQVQVSVLQSSLLVGANDTDSTGTAVIESLLPDHEYAINASRFGQQFNVTNIPSLFEDGNVVPWFNMTFVLPTYLLQVSVFKADGTPFNDVLVQIQDALGGLNNSAQTDTNGQVAFATALGRYVITVYDSNGIELNETSTDLFSDSNLSVYCDLYGLSVSITVVDYFGQPFSNVNVTLTREGQGTMSGTTQPNGTVTFQDVVGGDFQVDVYITSQTEPTVAEGLTVLSSTSTQIRVDRYVLLAGFLLQTSLIAIALVIISTVIVMLLIEVYVIRRRTKTEKDEDKTQNP